MGKPRIAIVARTIGLEYDDRIRKECIALSKKADIMIFANHISNQNEIGVTSYGIPYRYVSLKLRDLLPSSKYLFAKSIEFYCRIIRYLNRYNLVWAHEEYTYLFVLLAKNNKFVWDLHEIPQHFERPLLKPLFQYIEKKSRLIVHANEYRIRHLIATKTIKNPEKHLAIRNFPDESFVKSKKVDLRYEDFNDWLGKSDYIYLQGLSGVNRYPFNTLSAILESTKLKSVVVGMIDPVEYKKLQIKYKEVFEKQVFFTGMIDQLSITSYLCKAKFSIILYKSYNPNHRYCEANRFYQAIVLGIPVITGCNEPMSEIVNEYGFGIAMKSDGDDLVELKRSIEELLRNYEYYQLNVQKYGKLFMWSSEENKIQHLQL